MTPEQEAKLNELYSYMLARQRQQISAPLDEASLNALKAGVARALGSSTLTQSITIGAGGGSANVPAAYLGSLVVEFEGVRYEIPYLSTP